MLLLSDLASPLLPSVNPISKHLSMSRFPSDTRLHSSSSSDAATYDNKDAYDNIVVGGGIGGLTAFMLLQRMYDKETLLLESHPKSLGGVAHTFTLANKHTGRSFEFDAGPSLLTGLSRPSYNPLRQAFDMAGVEMPEMIEYSGWMIHSYGADEDQVSEAGGVARMCCSSSCVCASPRRICSSSCSCGLSHRLGGAAGRMGKSRHAASSLRSSL